MAVKVEPLEALLLEVRQERGVAERERATCLDLLAARKSSKRSMPTSGN
jgi:hypothetical protein